MAREIDLLVDAATDRYLVVEKATNQLWPLDELLDASYSGRYFEEDCIRAVEEPCEVSGPFPGCPQQAGNGEGFAGYDRVGQTRHFLLFKTI
jgi:hypothetical protein